jgi:hypothetical protein
MEAIPLRPRKQPAPARVLVLGERRCSALPSCAICGSRRKTWLRRVGWVCTACFDHCKERAEQWLDVGSGVARLRHAYEQAMLAYPVAYPARSPDESLPSCVR